MKMPKKSKILKRASKIMEIHEEVGYTPGHIRGFSDYKEGLRHMRHCVQLALDETSEKDLRIDSPDSDQLVGLQEKCEI